MPQKNVYLSSLTTHSHTCAHTCVYIHTHVHTCVYIHTHVHTCVYIHTHVHTCVYIHTQQPENILLYRKGSLDIKIADFGLAVQLQAGRELRNLVGTAEYVGELYT